MNRGTLQADLLASVVVFLVALPLCMGIAIASGMPPAAGLITGIVGGILAGALSGCPLQVSGPAAGMAVIVYEIVQKHGPGTLAVVVLLAGLLQLGAGFARAGQFFRAISPAVVYGMLAGIGVLIIGAQFHVMVDDKPRADGISNLLSIPESFIKGVFPPDGSSHHLAALLGAGTILLMFLWTQFAPKKVRWVPGALVGVTAATAIAFVLKLPVRYVQLGDNFFSSIQPTSFSSIASVFSADVLLLAVTVAFVASAETLLSAAAVDQMHDGPRADYNRELIAQGAGNLVCGFLGSLPMTGVIVRSATNVAAGAKTRASAMMHGVWLLVLVAAAAGMLRLVPTASLAAVLVYTGLKLVNVQHIMRLLRYGGAPVVIYAATVIGIVATDLLTGILIGLALSIVKVTYARTHFGIRVQQSAARSDVYLEGAATFLRLPKLADALNAIPAGQEIHIHLRGLDYVDDASLETISGFAQQRRDQGADVYIEWQEALQLYKDKNPLGRFQRAPVAVSPVAH